MGECHRLVLIGSSNEFSDCIRKVWDGEILCLGRASNFDFSAPDIDWFEENDMIIYNSAVLYSKQIEMQTKNERVESFEVNTIAPVVLIKKLNSSAKRFSFCYISSESARKGSFDDTYSLSKASVERFIEEFYLGNKDSRIFAIQLSTMLSGMTTRRSDIERLESYSLLTRKGFLDPQSIALCVINLFGKEWRYFTNAIIAINDGKFARRRY